jgi:hypothetical protein
MAEEDGAGEEGVRGDAEGESCVCAEEVMALVETCAERYTHLAARADRLLFFKLVMVGGTCPWWSVTWVSAVQ